MTAPRTPERRMGIYDCLDAVPTHRRLTQYTDDYEEQETWETFLSTHLFEKYDSDRFVEDARRAGRRWKKHMAAQGRHHALATPEDVQAWCEALLDDLAINTAYNQYWVRVEQFYTWLLWHRSHPHSYQPVQMAAAAGGAAADIWAEKLRRGHGDVV